MSEEEKKALEIVKEELQDQKQAFKYYKGVLGLYSNGKVEILLNLIDNQKKEIEELKAKNKTLDIENQGLFELYNFNDSSLLVKILKDYKELMAKQQKEIEEAKKYITSLDFFVLLCTEENKKDYFIAHDKLLDILGE